MKITSCFVLIFALLPLIACSSSIGSIGGLATVTSIEAVNRPIGGPSLSIEIKPGKQAKAGYYYIVPVEEKGKGGRYRTYITWNQAEINVLKPKIVHIPLADSEYKAYRNASNQLMNVFKVTIESKALTKEQLDLMIKSGVVGSY